jgi:hypothetical protein
MFDRYGDEMKDDKSAEDIFPPRNPYVTRDELHKCIGEEARKRVMSERNEFTEYVICECSSAHALSVQVSGYLKQGYRLWGSVTNDGGRFLYQAMVK